MVSGIFSIILVISWIIMLFGIIELVKDKQKKKTKLPTDKIKITLIISILVSFISFGVIAYTSDDINNNNTIGSNTTENETINEVTNELTDNNVNDEKLEENNIVEENVVENSEETNKENTNNEENVKTTLTLPNISLSNIPEFSSSPYTSINNGNPYFAESDLTTSSFEKYSNLDSLGRCGVAYACVGKDIMPTEKRGAIGSVKPSGWHTIKYDGIDGKYLYNRCHLIGYQLTGENANPKNLITGTRYLNTKGMLPFENMVADYVKETSNHVMYKVTPIFQGNNLVASGVLIEAESVEDNGAGIKFNVYCYNVQPGISINYENGDSSQVGSANTGSTNNSSQTSNSSQNSNKNIEQSNSDNKQTNTYILNKNTKKFHNVNCKSASKIKDSNKEQFTGTRQELIDKGYEPCKICNP